MNEKLLTLKQMEYLKSLAAGEEQVLARRAAILLAYHDGIGTEQIAQTLNISARLARYWRHAFVENGMSIFLEVENHADESARGTSVGRKMPAARITPPTLPGPPKKVGMLPGDSMQTAGRKVLRYQLVHMLSHEASTRQGEDIEALHDMRVASRRLRVALEIFEPYFPQKKIRSFRRDMRDLGRALGRVRDLDVFIEKTQAYIEALPPDESPALRPLLDAFGERRQQAHTALIHLLDEPETRQFLTEFENYLKQTDGENVSADIQPQPVKVSHLAPIFIYQRLAAVRAFEDILENASLEQLHALRSAFKYLRYTIEFFREALGEDAKSVLNDLRTIQDHLGNLNDAHLACGMLNDFLAEWEAQQNGLPIMGRQNPQGILTCLSLRSQERHRLLTEFPQVWQNFNRPEFRKILGGMLGSL
jgi:CHAD domain-containing protein